MKSLKKDIVDGYQSQPCQLRREPVLGNPRSFPVVSDLRSFEAGVLARRLIEHVVDDLIRSAGGKPGTDLFKKIESLHNRNAAQWISSYMHVLRIFGNESP